ncbi:AsmA-like C-terminal region-containing protein [Wolbachia endosymbiont of Chironomus riparius]|uniref:AsmA-like C-terminal region-containing protein n=1 Tax=Wolbachia endosymbiont of Chironomus riparius TaxID=2883238 RepID=UPI00209F0DDF|nr:AsmA-like C-terminal region-containing protein [Wolbachia endosymbiont of Chironomus riparius]
MKFFIYAALSFLIALFFMHTAVTIKDWSNYKDYITEELEKIHGGKVHIIGKIKASLMMPKLILHNVYIQYNQQKEKKLSDLVNISTIEIKPSLSSLFLFSFKPKSITLFDVKSDKKNLLNIINTKVSNKISNITIKESCISLQANNISIQEINLKENEKFSGKIKIKDAYYNFAGKINVTKKEIDIDIQSNLITLSFKGNKDQEKINGNLELTLNNSSNLVSELAKVVNFILLSNFIPSDSIKVLSSISMDENEFVMNDLKINSNSLKAVGIIHNDRKSNHTNVSINFNEINSEFTENNSKREINVKDLLECFKRTIPKDLSLDLNIEARNISYKKKIFDDFHAVVKFKEGKATVNAYLELPGISNTAHLSGKISSDNLLSKFDGNFQVKGNDFESFISCFFPSLRMIKSKKNIFALHSKLHFAPRIFAISDIKLIKDQEFLQGSLKVNYKKNRNIIDGGLSIYNLNINKYNLSNLSKVQWLKSFKYDVNIKSNFNDCILNDKRIKSLDFLLNIEKNKLLFNQIKIDGKDFDTSGNIEILLDQEYTKPLLNINFKGKEFNGTLITLPNFIEKTSNSRNVINWSKKQLDFLHEIERFDANININTEKFKTKYGVLQDFYFSALIENSTIQIRQISYILKDQKAFLQGYLRSGSMYTKFSISDLEADIIGKVIEVNNIKGKININGAVKTHGLSFDEWANNYSGEVKLTAKEVEVFNIDLNSLVTNFMNVKSKSEIATLTSVEIYKGSTPFRNLQGKAIINQGICSTSLQFEIDQSSGSVSANFDLSNFTLHSIFRLFFIIPNHDRSFIDIYLDGPIWKPKVNFEIDKIFNILKDKLLT